MKKLIFGFLVFLSFMSCPKALNYFYNYTSCYVMYQDNGPNIRGIYSYQKDTGSWLFNTDFIYLYKNDFDISSYTVFPKEVDIKIAKIIYYYNKLNTDNRKWYVASQLLIWQLLHPDLDVEMAYNVNSIDNVDSYVESIKKEINIYDNSFLEYNYKINSEMTKDVNILNLEYYEIENKDDLKYEIIDNQLRILNNYVGSYQLTLNYYPQLDVYQTTDAYLVSYPYSLYSNIIINVEVEDVIKEEDSNDDKVEDVIKEDDLNNDVIDEIDLENNEDKEINNIINPCTSDDIYYLFPLLLLLYVPLIMVILLKNVQK